MSFEANPICFRVKFTKELDELKNTVVLLDIVILYTHELVVRYTSSTPNQYELVRW